jgi:polysaccharide export outer membrane protein
MARLLLGTLLSLVLASLALAQVAETDPSGHTAASAPDDAYDYRLGAGDNVRILVFGEASLSGEFLVPGGEGVIDFPLVGGIKAMGLTVAELQSQLVAKLKDGYLNDPRVSIEVLNYRPFFILGAVARPGQYPYRNGLTVLNAVATADGFTYRANTHKVYIKRPNEVREEEYDLKSTTPVEPGDTIRIAERFF